MSDLNGTYLGYSPTDESAVGVGEIEIVIGDETMSMRFATGLMIETDSLPRADVRGLSSEEIAAHYENGVDTKDIRGLKIGEEGADLLFLPDDPDDKGPRLIVLGLSGGEIFGPSLLFSPSQVAAGLFDEAVRETENQAGRTGVIPRLANDGRAKPQDH